MNNTGPFKPFNTLKASEIVYNHIKKMILSGDIPAGEKIPSENELSEIFGKSRPTIREALRMLESNQYITIQRGKGATVNPITTYTIERTLEDLINNECIKKEDILAVRNVCETLAVELAAVRRTEEDIKELEDILEASSKHCTNYLDLMPYSSKFHQLLSKASKNGLFLLVCDMTSVVTDEMHTRYFQSLNEIDQVEDCQKVLSEHRAIFDAVVAQDSKAAAEAMRVNLLSSVITM